MRERERIDVQRTRECVKKWIQETGETHVRNGMLRRLCGAHCEGNVEDFIIFAQGTGQEVTLIHIANQAGKRDLHNNKIQDTK